MNLRVCDMSDQVKKREEEAAQLSDFDIWYSVVCKFIVMEMPVEARVEMIMQTIGDMPEMIDAVLKAALDDDEINNDMVNEIIEALKT